jgi:hypothetical protein
MMIIFTWIEKTKTWETEADEKKSRQNQNP